MSERYKVFEDYIKQTISGEGMIGDNHIVLIGSDGGDEAYGIDVNGRYIEVPFIGMDDEEVKIIAGDFDGFINYYLKTKR